MLRIWTLWILSQARNIYVDDINTHIIWYVYKQECRDLGFSARSLRLATPVSLKSESSNGISGKHDKTLKNWHQFHVWFQLCCLMLHAPSGKKNAVNFNISQAPWDYGGSFHFPNWWRTLHTGPIFAPSRLGPLKVGHPKSRCFDVTEFSKTNFTNFRWFGYLGGIPGSQTSLRSL